MSIAPAETAALLLTNRRQAQVIAGLILLALVLGTGMAYMVVLNRATTYTTISSGISLAMPGELDETVVADFSEAVVSRLGNVGPESIDGVSTWVLRRAQPQVRAQFEAWLSTERDRIVNDDLVFQLENPTTVEITKESIVGDPVYRVRVRGRQTIWIASKPLEPRFIDISMTVTVGPVGIRNEEASERAQSKLPRFLSNEIDLVIQTLKIPELLTVEGAVIHVIQESS